MTLPELLQRCAAGDEALQTAFLDEAEPLLFGYVRSLVPAGDASFERAVALTHAATLGFLLDLRAGRVRLADAPGLRAACHRIAVAVLRMDEPLFLTAEGDPETGALTPEATNVARAWESALDADATRAAAARLQGRPTPEDPDLARRLLELGLTRSTVPGRDAP